MTTHRAHVNAIIKATAVTTSIGMPIYAAACVLEERFAMQDFTLMILCAVASASLSNVRTDICLTPTLVLVDASKLKLAPWDKFGTI